jgi:hypothetical protein
MRGTANVQATKPAPLCWHSAAVSFYACNRHFDSLVSVLPEVTDSLPDGCKLWYSCGCCHSVERSPPAQKCSSCVGLTYKMYAEPLSDHSEAENSKRDHPFNVMNLVLNVHSSRIIAERVSAVSSWEDASRLCHVTRHELVFSDGLQRYIRPPVSDLGTDILLL